MTDCLEFASAPPKQTPSFREDLESHFETRDGRQVLRAHFSVEQSAAHAARMRNVAESETPSEEPAATLEGKDRELERESVAGTRGSSSDVTVKAERSSDEDDERNRLGTSGDRTQGLGRDSQAVALAAERAADFDAPTAGDRSCAGAVVGPPAGAWMAPSEALLHEAGEEQTQNKPSFHKLLGAREGGHDAAAAAAAAGVTFGKQSRGDDKMLGEGQDLSGGSGGKREDGQCRSSESKAVVGREAGAIESACAAHRRRCT